jgi:hypothetical protein
LYLEKIGVSNVELRKLLGTVDQILLLDLPIDEMGVLLLQSPNQAAVAQVKLVFPAQGEKSFAAKLGKVIELPKDAKIVKATLQPAMCAAMLEGRLRFFTSLFLNKVTEGDLIFVQNVAYSNSGVCIVTHVIKEYTSLQGHWFDGVSVDLYIAASPQKD